jgi:hypothetical protein
MPTGRARVGRGHEREPPAFRERVPRRSPKAGVTPWLSAGSALSLLVVITDTKGDQLYVDAGGLSLASRIDGNSFKDLPEDSLFGDPVRNASSVRLALAALTRPEGK